ncbi:HD domain-containing protein [Caloramator quimbayensis]|uniref:HD domain-containing protein n=1 Tax=Caloramator quimbayensis TaxID=1147123 RepID=A0A1T4WEI6_9CLOT|nr:HD domain-containing phosphohydrolase [Caloramator quimbayensis]SKA75428.1 HD domain-containing protein [Caloramator quimbayensis]
MLNIDLNQLLSSLSMAIDLSHCSISYEESLLDKKSNISPIERHRFFNHSKRTCYVSLCIAKLINEDKDFLNDVYISSVLHDIGVTSSIDKCHGDDIFIRKHCLNGEDILKKFPIDSNISKFVKYHHENYNGTGCFKLSKDDIPLISQIIRLADIFEILYDETKPNYFQRKKILDYILKERGTILSPFITDLFIKAQSVEMFWWDVDNLSFSSNVINDVIPKDYIPVSLEDLKSIAVVFADIIDNNSHFTFKHSYNLSKLTEKISDYLCFSYERKVKFSIAALLHDIGKLAVPNYILNKNGKLDEIETSIIKCHTYYTYLILSKIKGLEDIASWASNHHEKPNGTGYPKGLKSEDLSLEDRLLAICDIYEALTSDRPYKSGMPKEKAFEILYDMAAKKDVCGEALNIVKKCF